MCKKTIDNPADRLAGATKGRGASAHLRHVVVAHAPAAITALASAAMARSQRERSGKLESFRGTFSQVDVYDSPSGGQFVLVGHGAGGSRHILHVHRRPATAAGNEELPVSEELQTQSEASCEARLRELIFANLPPDEAQEAPLAPMLRACALLGMVRFLEGWYMLFVTRTDIVGVIGGHAIHRVEETAMVSVARQATDGANSTEAAPATAEPTGGGDGESGSANSSAAAASASSGGGSAFGLFRGGKRFLHAAASGIAARLRVENW